MIADIRLSRTETVCLAVPGAHYPLHPGCPDRGVPMKGSGLTLGGEHRPPNLYLSNRLQQKKATYPHPPSGTQTFVALRFQNALCYFRLYSGDITSLLDFLLKSLCNRLLPRFECVVSNEGLLKSQGFFVIIPFTVRGSTLKVGRKSRIAHATTWDD